MSEWKTYQLGDITEWFSGGTPSKRNESYWKGEIPWISARTLKGTRVSNSDLKISSEGLKQGSKLAEKNDLLLLVRGSGLFNSIPISIVETPVAYNQDIKAIRIKKEYDFISPWFLLYWFYANTRILNSIMEETGIGAGKFDLQLLKSLIIQIPPQRELIELTKTFKSIDDKIILLHQQNQTLEELAQTLFKRWFVDFEFPNENGKPYKSSGGEMMASELGEIPRGWKVGEVSNFVNHSTKSLSPNKTPEILFNHYSIPAFDNGRFPSIDLGSTILSNKYIVLENSILVSKLNPKTSRIWPVFTPQNNAICSTEIQVFIPHSNTYSFCFGLFHHPNVKREMQQRASGTSSSHQRVRPSDILNIECIIPNMEIILHFEEIVLSSLIKTEKNQEEIQSLTNFRDTLLPKLMSGELKIKDL